MCNKTHQEYMRKLWSKSRCMNCGYQWGTEGKLKYVVCYPQEDRPGLAICEDCSSLWWKYYNTFWYGEENPPKDAKRLWEYKNGLIVEANRVSGTVAEIDTDDQGQEQATDVEQAGHPEPGDSGVQEA